MKYIQTKKEFTQEEPVNEELLGGLFKNLFANAKSKIAVAISKNIGSIKEIDSMLSQYKSTIGKLMQPKIDVLKEITEMELAIDNGGEGSLEELKKLVSKYNQTVNNVDAQIKNAKAKFDAQVSQVTKKEKNDDIKDYITLKKFDMAQEFLQMELNMINNGSGLSKEQVANSETLKKINADLTAKAKEISATKEKAENEISSNNSDDNTEVQSATPNEFDEEKAERDGNYSWNSKFSNGEYVFTTGEEIKYWSISQKEVKPAFIVDQNKANLSRKLKDSEVLINTTKGETSGSFPISKGKVVSTTKDDNAKQANEKSREANANAKESGNDDIEV